MINEQHGLINTVDRVLTEILKKPNIKNTIRIVLNSIDPESSSILAKHLMWQDPELSLSVASVLPAIINSTLTFIDTALDEVKEKITTDTLHGFSEELLKEIDTEKIISIKKNFTEIFESLFPLAKKTFDIKGEGK